MLPVLFSFSQSEAQGKPRVKWQGYVRNMVMGRDAEYRCRDLQLSREVKMSVTTSDSCQPAGGPDAGLDRAAAVEGSSGRIFASKLAMLIYRCGSRGQNNQRSLSLLLASVCRNPRFCLGGPAAGTR